MVDLFRGVENVVSLPLKEWSIKKVSTHLGFEWPGPRDYRAAYIDYRSWLDTNDLPTLARACTYQRADVHSLAYVWRWLVKNAP